MSLKESIMHSIVTSAERVEMSERIVKQIAIEIIDLINKRMDTAHRFAQISTYEIDNILRKGSVPHIKRGEVIDTIMQSYKDKGYTVSNKNPKVYTFTW